MSLRTLFAVVAFQVCFGVSALALAQAPPANAPDPTTPEGKRAEGKARYQRGAEAYAAGRYKDAIDLFLQADALAPSAALSFNIARAYEKIDDDAATLQWFRDFRRRAPDAKNGPEVDARIHELELLLAKKGVQQLTVLSSPLGATVIVDEQPLGVTPFTGQFPPGPHKIVLSLRGYADSQRKLELPADRAQLLNIPLVPARSAPAVPSPEVPASPASVPVSAASTLPADRQRGPRFGVWPWIGLGAGAAALGGALGFELLRRSAESDARNDETQVGYKDKLDRMQARQTTARILAAVGGALAVAGGTLLVVDLATRPSRKARAALACGGFGCSARVEAAF